MDNKSNPMESRIFIKIDYEKIMWIALLWITMTIVRALQSKQAQSDRYWGI